MSSRLVPCDTCRHIKFLQDFCSHCLDSYTKPLFTRGPRRVRLRRCIVSVYKGSWKLSAKYAGTRNSTRSLSFDLPFGKHCTECPFFNQKSHVCVLATKFPRKCNGAARFPEFMAQTPQLVEVSQEEIDAVAKVPDVVFANCKFDQPVFRSSVHLLDCTWKSLRAIGDITIHHTQLGLERISEEGARFIPWKEYPSEGLLYTSQVQLDAVADRKDVENPVVFKRCCFDKVTIRTSNVVIEESTWNFITCDGKDASVELHNDILKKYIHSYRLINGGSVTMAYPPQEKDVLRSVRVKYSKNSHFNSSFKRLEFWGSEVLGPITFPEGMQGEVWMDETSKKLSASAFPLKITNGAMVD